jgi:hypothetical protein
VPNLLKTLDFTLRLRPSCKALVFGRCLDQIGAGALAVVRPIVGFLSLRRQMLGQCLK